MSPGREKRSSEQAGVDLSTRLALRPKEAARALGISERALRSLLPRLPHFREGNLVLVPVDDLRGWLSRRALAERGEVDAVVDEVLGDLLG